MPTTKTNAINARHRALTEKIVGRIVSDPAFRKKLAANPERALSEAGFAKEADELSRLSAIGTGPMRCKVTCGFRSCGKAQLTCSQSCKLTEKVSPVSPV
jgi:hypothetical protein